MPNNDELIKYEISTIYVLIKKNSLILRNKKFIQSVI